MLDLINDDGGGVALPGFAIGRLGATGTQLGIGGKLLDSSGELVGLARCIGEGVLAVFKKVRRCRRWWCR